MTFERYPKAILTQVSKLKRCAQVLNITFTSVLPKLASSSAIISLIFNSCCLSSGNTSPITLTTTSTRLLINNNSNQILILLAKISNDIKCATWWKLKQFSISNLSLTNQKYYNRIPAQNHVQFDFPCIVHPTKPSIIVLDAYLSLKPIIIGSEVLIR